MVLLSLTVSTTLMSLIAMGSTFSGLPSRITRSACLPGSCHEHQAKGGDSCDFFPDHFDVLYFLDPSGDPISSPLQKSDRPAQVPPPPRYTCCTRTVKYKCPGICMDSPTLSGARGLSLSGDR